MFFFLNRFNKQHGKRKRISEEALTLLSQHSWPGNVRELAHLVERLVVTVEDEVISKNHLPTSIYEAKGQPMIYATPAKTLDDAIDSLERKIILEAQAIHGSSRKVAQALGISQSRASRLLRKHSNNSESDQTL